MLSTQQAQTGNRVYGGYSQAPNQGQVSAAGAQGYIKRELRNKNRAGVLRRVGGDGLSDNRSAVAAQSLQRMRGSQVPQPHNGGRPVTQQQGGKGGKVPHRGPEDGRPVGNHQQGQGGPSTPPTVEISADGTLQLPYDQAWATEQLAAINDANSQLLALKQEGDQQAQEYGQVKRDTQLNYQQLAKQSLNQNAAGGTAFSSQYGTAVANNANQYANQLSDLEQQNTGFLNNQHLQQSTIQASLNQQLAALAQQQADALNEQAGSLGYGHNKPVRHSGMLKKDERLSRGHQRPKNKNRGKKR